MKTRRKNENRRRKRRVWEENQKSQQGIRTHNSNEIFFFSLQRRTNAYLDSSSVNYDARIQKLHHSSSTRTWSIIFISTNSQCVNSNLCPPMPRRRPWISSSSKSTCDEIECNDASCTEEFELIAMRILAPTVRAFNFSTGTCFRFPFWLWA